MTFPHNSDERLHAYRQAIQAMRNGHFSVPIALQSKQDQIGLLGVELNMLGQWLEQRFSEISKLHQVATEISSGLLIDEVLDRVYDSFHALIPYDRIGCALLSEDGRSVQARWAKADYPVKRMKVARGFKADLAGSSLETILATGEPRIINDLEAHFEVHPRSTSTRLMLDESIRSSLTCPLNVEGKPVGFLFFSSRGKDTYRDAHQMIFRHIAGQVSALIEKSHLYQQIQELNRKLLDAQADLKELSLRDSLTGTLNHGAIMESLSEHWQLSQRKSSLLTVIMADADYFKNINDTHGHLAGDAVLKAVARTLQKALRGHDRLGRYGGEEFMVVLFDTALEAGARIAERMREEVATLEIPFDGKTLKVNMSFGLACNSDTATLDPVRLVSQADAALYEAKRSGRNRVCLAKPDAGL
jgi:diguanylate cyclase (GGDEF)-like protein